MNNLTKRLSAAISAAIMALTSLPAALFANADTTLVYEAENASYSGMTAVSDSSFSGGKYLNMQDSGSCTFTVSVTSSGFYDLTFTSSGQGGDKYNNAAVDGESIGQFFSKSEKVDDYSIKLVYLSTGSHKVTITKSWGWIRLDCLKITKSTGTDRDFYDVSKALINPSASESAQRLMSFIVDNYGTNVISGQTCDNGLNGNEFKAIKNLTGKTPAMLGMDLMRYTPTRVAKGDNCKTVENAIEFSNAGGIVELCWHWNAPDKYLKSGTDSNGNPRWWGGFYTDNLNIDLSKIMDGTDSEGYDLLIKDIDAIAVQLKKLKDADVPILFRPLHEASGGWFWWGSDGSEPYKKLWKTMYDKLTNEYGLDNLIWVWNGQSKDWYPGDEYVDIIGEDIYAGNHVYNAQSSKFLEAAQCTSTNKVVALTENGCLFDIDKALDAGTVWSWFCVWCGEFCSNGSTISETFTEASMWKKVYTHPNVITLDEMPDLKTYPLEDTPATAVKLSASSKTVTAGQSFTLTAALTPSNSNEKPTWSTSNQAVVTVTNGKCIAKAPGTATVKCKLANGKTASCVVSVKPAAVSGIAKGGNSTSACRLKWNTVNGAEGYEVYVTDANGKYIKTVKTSVNNIKVDGLSSGKTYKFKVRAYKGTLYGGYSATLPYTTLPSQTTGLKMKSLTTGTINLTWNKVSGAEKYVVYKYNSAKKVYVPCKTVSTNSASISGLASGTSYNFKVRAYKTVGTTKYYGAASSALSAITRPSAVSASVKAGTKSFYASWSKVRGASGYQIVYSSSPKFSTYKIATVSSSASSKTISSLVKGRKYYVKIRAYKTCGGVKYFGAYSTVKTVTAK